MWAEEGKRKVESQPKESVYAPPRTFSCFRFRARGLPFAGLKEEYGSCVGCTGGLKHLHAMPTASRIVPDAQEELISTC